MEKKINESQIFVDHYSLLHNKFINPTNIRYLEYFIDVDILKYQTRFLNQNFKQQIRNSNYDLDNLNWNFINYVKIQEIQPLAHEINIRMDKDALDYEKMKYRHPFDYKNNDINILQIFKDMKKRIHHGNFSTTNKYLKQENTDDQFAQGDFIIYKDFTTEYYKK